MRMSCRSKSCAKSGSTTCASPRFVDLFGYPTSNRSIYSRTLCLRLSVSLSLCLSVSRSLGLMVALSLSLSLPLSLSLYQH